MKRQRPQPSRTNPAFEGLALRDLSILRPGTGRPLLENVNLIVEPGNIVEISGKSGSGKTVLAKAITGLISSDGGSIRISNQDLANIPTRALSNILGYVPEDIRFVPGTIGCNIARMEKSLDIEKVVVAAQRAQAHDMIESLPSGYLTQLDETGSQLSKGERQLIALARALYISPNILIFDEPGSAYADVLGKNLLERLHTYKDQGNIVIIFSQSLFRLSVTDRTYVIEANRLKLVKHGIKTVPKDPQSGKNRNCSELV